MKLLLTSLISLGVLATHAHAAVYISPTNKRFVKLDKLTIDLDSMEKLSNMLVGLALAQTDQTAKALRAKAKIMAIAAQLNPENMRVDSANQALKKGRSQSPNEQSPEVLKQRELAFTHLLNYLKKQQLGSESHSLYLRITSSLAVIYPAHPLVKEADLTPLAWSGIVASHKAFAKHKDEVLINSERIKHSKNDVGSTLVKPIADTFINEIDAVVPVLDLREWSRDEEQIKLPLYTSSNTTTNTNEITVGTLKITITPQSSNPENQITLTPDSLKLLGEQSSNISGSLSKILALNWENGYVAASIEANSNVGKVGKRNKKKTLMAAIATALDASLVQQKLAPNLIVAASINSTSMFERNNDFWKLLPSLIKLDKSHRILIAKEAEGDLRQLLVMGDSQFFIQHEIMAITDFKDSRKYRKDNLDGDIAKASQLFKEVQNALKGKSVRAMASNSHVRAKLNEIHALNPRHISAKMLLILGSTSKPKSIDSKYIGYEIRAILSEVSSLLAKSANTINGEELIEMGEKIEKRVETVQRFIDLQHNDALDDVDELAKILQRAGKSKFKSDDYNSSSTNYRNFNEQIRKLKELNANLRVQSAALINPK